MGHEVTVCTDLPSHPRGHLSHWITQWRYRVGFHLEWNSFIWDWIQAGLQDQTKLQKQATWTPIASPSTISLAFPPLTAPPSTRTDGCCPLPHSGNPADTARGNFSRSVNSHWGGMRDLQGLRLYRNKSLAPWGKDSHPTEMGRTWRSWWEKEGCYNYHPRPKVSSRSGSVSARICANWCFFLPDSSWWEDWGLMTFLVSDEHLTELTPRYGSFIYYVGDINPLPTGKIRTDAWEGEKMCCEHLPSGIRSPSCSGPKRLTGWYHHLNSGWFHPWRQWLKISRKEASKARLFKNKKLPILQPYFALPFFIVLCSCIRVRLCHRIPSI